MLADWDGFFQAQVAAAAALTGLIFVAISINLQRIVTYPGLVGRAAEALLLVVAPLFVGLAMIQAGQSLRAVGVEDLVITGGITAFVVRILATSGWAGARDRAHSEFGIRVTLAVGALLPGLVAAFMLIGGSTDGFYAQALSTGLCIAAGIADAWVLLVEILR